MKWLNNRDRELLEPAKANMSARQESSTSNRAVEIMLILVVVFLAAVWMLG
jgi:hypothetical protein